jgi:predicted kinase
MEVSHVTADARRLAGALGRLPAPRPRPAFIVVSGLPGTGKSYFCRRLAERLAYPVLESDALRKELFPTPTYSAAESARLFRAIHGLIEGLLGRGVPVILDATNLSERHRESLYAIAGRTGARLVMVRIVAPPELVKSRLEARAAAGGAISDAGWAVYRKLKPTADRIRRRHLTVDTSRDITPALDEIVREAEE